LLDERERAAPAMTDRYYDTARREVLPWLPQRVARLLDVGCGAGATTAAIREARQVEWAGGIEHDPEAAQRAEARLDRVWRGDAAQVPIESEIAPGSLDLVLCLDVLEHLPDPWQMVRRLSQLVAPGGRLIVSVPNIRNWKFILRLAVRGDFAYRDAGLLDRTHLRFFVRSTAVDLATCGGLRLVSAVPAQAWRFPEPRWWLAKASGGTLEEFMAKQWLVVVEQSAGGPIALA
jgi:2-polyprenyl-3-methyl-5-hydroxy-6-metoxy-1,4-benzoquinol methylase